MLAVEQAPQDGGIEGGGLHGHGAILTHKEGVATPGSVWWRAGMVRVLVCDDSLGFPALVTAWLDDDARLEHAGTARSGTELLKLARATPADVVLLDLVLPDVDNPAALVTALRELQPGLRVLLVSSLALPELERAAAVAGVDGFAHKAITAGTLTDELYRLATAG